MNDWRTETIMNYRGKRIRFTVEAKELLDNGFEIPYKASFRDYMQAVAGSEKEAENAELAR